MSFLRNISSGLRYLFRKEQVDRELDEELGAYLEMAAAEKMKDGLSRKDALRAVRLEHGSVEVTKEVVRSAGWESFVETCWSDLRFAARMLRRSPGFTTVAILTLALGIGVNTAMFTAFDAVALKRLPVENPQDVMRMLKWFASGAQGDVQFAFSCPEYFYYRDHTGVFGGIIAASWPFQATATGQTDDGQASAGFGAPQSVIGQLVSANYFSELGIRPLYGRTFAREEEGFAGARPIIVISYRFWQRHFHSDPNAIGTALELNSTVFSVIGITPLEFTGTANPPTVPDFWAPLGMQPQLVPGHDWLNDSREHEIQLIGRLSPGLTRARVQSGLDVVFRNYLTLPGEHPETDKIVAITLQPATYFGGTNDWRFKAFVALLMAVVGLVLLVACANFANMLLARATGRRREIAVRLALGAGRRRAVRLLLTESVLLAVLGGVAGLFFSLWASKALWLEIAHVMESSLGRDLTSVVRMDLNLRVLSYTMILSLVTGIIFGVSPALRATRPDLAAWLKDEGNALGGSATRSRVRSMLVAGQVAASMFLLISAGLLSKALLKSQTAQPGFDTKNVFLVDFDRPSNALKTNEVVRQVVDFVKSLPEVDSACVVDRVPFLGTWTPPIIAEGSPVTVGNRSARTLANYVSPGYFSTLEIPIVLGRNFSDQEILAGAKVAIVSYSAARLFWPGMNPLGKRIKLDLTFHGDWAEFGVIGVAQDVRTANLSRMDSSFTYLPVDAKKFYDYNVLIRPRGDASSARSSVRASLGGRKPRLELGRSLDGFLGAQKVMPEAIAMFTLVLALLAIALAAVGIYGVMSFLVAQRTREIGIRVALGAKPRDVLRVVIGDGLRPVFLGGIVGLLISVTASAVLRATLISPGSPDLLFGVGAFDPLTFVGFSCLLAAVALLACYIPAHRAMRVDPIVALRYE